MSSIENECLLALDFTSSELEDILKDEKSSLVSYDKELTKVEDRLEEIRVSLEELDKMSDPNMNEVEELYSEFLELSDRQSQLTDLITVTLETVGICELALY